MSDSIPIHGHCDPRFSRVRDVFEENFRKGGDIGASVAFTIDGEFAVDLWGGWVDEAKTREWQRDTIVNVYSTTKAMTAVCALHLVDASKLAIDEPVASYWPEFAAEGKQSITVRQLLNHTAGLPAIRRQLDSDALYDWDTMVRALAEQAPWWEPGTRHGYHAMTFGHLVGEVVRRASGQTLGDYFRQHIAEPLGADFHIGLAAEHDPRVSELHGTMFGSARPKAMAKSEGNSKLPPALRDFMRDISDPATMSGGAFNNPASRRGRHNESAWRRAEIPAANGHGNARSLARIYSALARGGEVDGVRILQPETLERATREEAFGPDEVIGGLPMRFGLGFMLRHSMMPMTPSEKSFGHAGAGGSMGVADPDAKVGFGYAMNQMQMGLSGGRGAYRMLRVFFETL